MGCFSHLRIIQTKYQLALVLVLAALAHSMPNKKANKAIADAKNQAAEGLNKAQSWLDNYGIKFDLAANLNTAVQAGQAKLNSDETQQAIQGIVGKAQDFKQQTLNNIEDPALKKSVRKIVNQGQKGVQNEMAGIKLN